MLEWFDKPFYQFTAILALAALAGGIGIRLKQPLIMMFIVVGVSVGPSGLALTQSGEGIDLFAKMGITLLLFLVGLKLDVQVIRGLGPIALATGVGQIILTVLLCLPVCLALGFTWVESLYLSVAFSFSSTILSVKLLSDKREIDALHGRISVGVLIIQDIVVVMVMIALSALGSTGEVGKPWLAGLALLGKGILFLAVILLTMRYVLPFSTRTLAKSQELLILFAIAWALLLAAVAVGIGLSKEVGAFLAGVSLASTPYRESIGGRLVSLRDFLLLFFFIELGAGLDMAALGQQIIPAMVLSLFILLGKPLIVLLLMGPLGYRKRTGFLAGITLAQISEFSLIMAALGVTLGHISPQVKGVITLIGLITFGLSTYMILSSHKLYEWLAPRLSIFERKCPYREEQDDVHRTDVDFVLVGLGRFGSNIAQRLRDAGGVVLGVDFDPEVILAWHKLKCPAQYGDAEDPEFTSSLPLSRARWVVCTSPRRETNLMILHALREQNYPGRIALTAHSQQDVVALEKAGADLVLMPFVDAATVAAAQLLQPMIEASSPS